MSVKVMLIFILGPIGILVIIGIFVSSHLIKKKYTKLFEESKTVIRSLIIDKENKIVKFFNRNEIHNVKTIQYDQFLTQFSSVDIDKFNNWLTYLLKKDEVKGEYLEIEVFLNATRKKYVSVLKALGAVKDKKIIYIDSYLLPHINKSKIYKEEPVNFNNIYKRFNIYPTSKGYTINFKIAYLDAFGNMDQFNKLIYATLENIVFESGSHTNRYIIEYSKEDLMIFDYKSFDEKNVKNYISKILNRFNRYLEVNSLNNSIRLSAGCISNINFQKNIIKLSEEAIRLSEVAINNEYKYIVFKKNAILNENYLSLDEMLALDVDFTYLPIYSVSSSSIIGYFSILDKHNPNVEKLYTSFAKLYKQNDVVQVVKHFFKKIIDSYSLLDVKKEYSLFLDAQVNLLDVIMSQLNKTKEIKKVNVVVCVDEKDAYSYGNNIDKFKDYLSKITSKNVKVCLNLKDKNLVFDNKIYELFDYFTVEVHFDKKGMGESSNLSYRIIVERLLKFKKPIIISNVNDFDEVELLVRSGITYICSPIICPTLKTLSEPNPKIVTKIKHLLD